MVCDAGLCSADIFIREDEWRGLAITRMDCDFRRDSKGCLLKAFLVKRDLILDHVFPHIAWKKRPETVLVGASGQIATDVTDEEVSPLLIESFSQKKWLLGFDAA